MQRFDRIVQRLKLLLRLGFFAEDLAERFDVLREGAHIVGRIDAHKNRWRDLV
ncbi:hypothetical protein D1872_328680 [compost metagenome]